MDIKLAAGFGGVCQFVKLLIFIDKVHQKSGLTFHWGRGGGFMKNVVVTFSFPKSIYEWPLKYNKGSITLFLEGRMGQRIGCSCPRLLV